MEHRKQFLTLPEVAAQVGVCVATVRRLIERGELPAKRVGRQYRVPARDFNTWWEGLDARSR
jgi:excisionase family DNA binding protein